MDDRLLIPKGSPLWLTPVIQSIDRAIRGNRHMRDFTVATLPTAAPPYHIIYVTDEAGGAVPAFNDGTNWRRVTDRAIVS